MSGFGAVRAVVFDVFGTLVDWHGSVLRDLERYGAARALACDWRGLVEAWRRAYAPAMDAVRGGARPWATIDALHGEALDAYAPRFGLAALSSADRAWFVRRWHELEPWPDARDGLAALRRERIAGTLSNGNVALQIDLARHGDLRFDVLFSAEHFGRYKPDRETYLGAAAMLAIEPRALMLAAAHPSDLDAAAALGLRTAYVRRPREWGDRAGYDEPPARRYDLRVDGIGELAERLARG